MFESKEAALVMLGDRPALLERKEGQSLPDRIDDEWLANGSVAVRFFDDVAPNAKIDGYYYRSVAGLCYYQCGKVRWRKIYEP